MCHTKQMKNRITIYAVIRIWSCQAASTYRKCSNLKSAANELDATIYANTGDVFAGPDGNITSRLSRRFEAWILGENEGEWKVFTPRPKMQAKGFKPGPKAYVITKEETKAK